jgi:hypothetical protein
VGRVHAGSIGLAWESGGGPKRVYGDVSLGNAASASRDRSLGLSRRDPRTQISSGNRSVSICRLPRRVAGSLKRSWRVSTMISGMRFFLYEPTILNHARSAQEIIACKKLRIVRHSLRAPRHLHAHWHFVLNRDGQERWRVDFEIG